jgi:hypothetical protein
VSRYLLKLSDLVVTVIPPHAAFYRYKLACQQVGPKGFHKKTGVKCVLLAHHLASVDHLNQDAKWRTLYRYYVPLGRKRFEIKNLREMIQPIDNCEISHFLRLRPEINELAALKNHAVNFEEGLPQ